MLGQTKGKALGIAIILLVAAAGVLFLIQSRQTPKTSQPKSAEEKAQILIREDSYQRGQPNAPVTIVEFVDFQCEACAYMYPITNRILSEYEGKTRLVIRYWPLDQHQNSLAAAYAVEAAGELGKYWEMVELLLTDQNFREWSASNNPWPIFVNYAKNLDLDGFPTDFQSAKGKYAAKVERDKQDAITLQLKGVPSFFINGTDYVYIQSYEEFKEKIETALSDRTTMTEDDVDNGRLLNR
ncbi:MAG: thioredoxin domain-containing protein [Candidatus Levybacteria bacterium]|nr:thioredoxin domain-containing protein [Candidatus Levybacteria bacterium]